MFNLLNRSLALVSLCSCLMASAWESEIRAASAFVEQGDYNSAEQTLRSAVRLAETGQQSATAWNNLGSVFADQGRYHEAENAFRRSIRLWEKHCGIDCPPKANALNNLGGLLVDLGRLKEAQRHITQSLDLRRRNQATLDPTPALNNLALVQLEQRRYQAAESSLREALVRCSAENARCSGRIVSIYHNLALAMARQGRQGESIAMFHKAIETGERLWKPGHPALGWTYLELASAYTKSEQYDLAEPLFDKVLKIHSLGPHPMIHRALEDYGKLQLLRNRKAEGKSLLHQARQMKTLCEARERAAGHVVDFETLKANL